MKKRTKEDAKKCMKMSKEELVGALMVAYDLLDAWGEVIMEEYGTKAKADMLLKVSRLVTKEAMLQATPNVNHEVIETIEQVLDIAEIDYRLAKGE